MPDYKEEISRREKADEILLTDKSADLKLYEIFQLYKEDIKKFKISQGKSSEKIDLLSDKFMSKVSVVVPVYNVEKLLQRCFT